LSVDARKFTVTAVEKAEPSCNPAGARANGRMTATTVGVRSILEKRIRQ
jgi:hypothetical protein